MSSVLDQAFFFFFGLMRIAGSLEHARVHPKFLHSNATSHKWAFGGKVLYLAVYL